ncbi:MAG TPA: PTS sugar transporter subunit IIA [Candidatus Methylacidiphilales bacterium]|nr:PTS sugar transporter subunit IIA [Candidatus Methylacidiphilales bacterium]
MHISSLLKPEQITLAIQNSKRCPAIHEVALLAKTNPLLLQFEGFYEELLARERVESTCLGNELAFPHARTDHLKGMILCVGRSSQGILFENCGQIVKLIFVIGTPKRMVTDYLSVVGGLARLLKKPELRQELMGVATPEDFIGLIEKAEGR